VEWVYTLVFALLGVAVGSFLNVCIDRLPSGRSILNPPSQCDSCHHRLAVADLIPLFSYLRLHGRCRYCQAPIPGRVFWVELATGVIFALLYQYYGLTSELGLLAFYASLFIIIFVVDWEQGLILNKVVYPSMVAALLIAAFQPQPWLGSWPFSGAANAALGGGIGFVLFLSLVVVSRGGMGWGDVKLAALIGLAVGYPLVLVALLIGAILGGVVGAILLATKKRRPGETIPYGPFLSLAAMITLLWGSDILSWYKGLL
jgi:leader peptidase (prepilin peptidase)/N-methyltransferase